MRYLLATALVAGAGCRTHRPAGDRPAPPAPWGRVVYSDPARNYAIIDFDVWPVPGQVLQLVDTDGPTAVVRVSERRIGSYFIVDITGGAPNMGDHVAITEEEDTHHADD